MPSQSRGFRGRIDEAAEHKITEPGLNAVICQPHIGVGMAALIVGGGDTTKIALPVQDTGRPMQHTMPSLP